MMPLFQKYRENELARKRMAALKNIRYLFENFGEKEVKFKKFG